MSVPRHILRSSRFIGSHFYDQKILRNLLPNVAFSDNQLLLLSWLLLPCLQFSDFKRVKKLPSPCFKMLNQVASAMYRDKIYQCMTSTQELVGIHNDSAHKSWSKYTNDAKVRKVNYNSCNIKCKCKTILNQNNPCN